MKILYVTTIGNTMSFFKEFIKELLDEGHTVDIATNYSTSSPPECYAEWGCRIFSLTCSRSVLNKGNIRAIKQIEELVQKEKYDIVHCHTPIAATCTRIACGKLRKTQGVKVFYTAHGFHFYKGAPLKNWLIYYPIEKVCSYFTDKLITINKEDYKLAKKKMKAKEVCYVPGVGIDISKFMNITVDRDVKRREIGVPEDAVLFASVGELIERKNHQIIIQALNKIENENIHYIIAGDGPLLPLLKKYVKQNKLEKIVHFLGYRNDIAELYKASDVCCLPSVHEGLPVALMEAMACGLPVLCSRIRGNVDLIGSKGGFLFTFDNVEECKKAIISVLNCNMKNMGKFNQTNILGYSTEKVITIMRSIYEC